MLVVDVQEAFRPHIYGFADMVAAIQLLLGAAREIELPVIATQQYPQGLGQTVSELEPLLDGAHRYDKLEISACAAPPFTETIERAGDIRTVVVAGIETHVCINQTVHDLLHGGYRVHLVADGVGSRDPWQREVALERLASAGAIVTTVEAALFELLECAGTDRFKRVQKLIKQHDASRAASAATADDGVQVPA